eukprot:2988156-Amphidinium_carterae.2
MDFSHINTKGTSLGNVPTTEGATLPGATRLILSRATLTHFSATQQNPGEELTMPNLTNEPGTLSATRATRSSHVTS